MITINSHRDYYTTFNLNVEQHGEILQRDPIAMIAMM